MKVCVLSPYPERIVPFLWEEEVVPEGGEWLVCYGHRKVLTPNELRPYQGRAINIHIGMLPENRGADPNFWSWFNNTKKGVTIHQLDAGLDTGRILVQAEVTQFHGDDATTLRTTYEALMKSASLLFGMSWGHIKAGNYKLIKQSGLGSFHYRKDKDQFMAQLPLGWDTPVSVVEELGRKHREAA